MIDRVVYHGASEQLVIRLATGEVVQALSVRDGSQHEWAQGTPVQVHLPEDALRVLPPSSAAETATALAAEGAPEDPTAPLEVSAG
jgi:hypothetical protein